MTIEEQKVTAEKIKNAFIADIPEIQLDIEMTEGLFYNCFFMFSCIVDIDIYDPEVEGEDEEVDEILMVAHSVFDEVFLNFIDPDEGTMHFFGLIMILEDEE